MIRHKSAKANLCPPLQRLMIVAGLQENPEEVCLIQHLLRRLGDGRVEPSASGCLSSKTPRAMLSGSFSFFKLYTEGKNLNDLDPGT